MSGGTSHQTPELSRAETTVSASGVASDMSNRATLVRVRVRVRVRVGVRVRVEVRVRRVRARVRRVRVRVIIKVSPLNVSK